MCESRERVQKYRAKRRKLEELRQFTRTSVTKTSREVRSDKYQRLEVMNETHKNETYVSSKKYFILYLFYLFYSCYYNINFIT